MAMTPERAALKTRLLKERVVTITHPETKQKRTGLFCELCGKEYREGWAGPQYVSGLDLNEVIITRGAVRGNERLTKLVTESEYNTDLLCNSCNVVLANTKGARNLLTQKLVMRYCSRAIIAWIESLGLKCPTPFIQLVKIAAEVVEKPPAPLYVPPVDKSKGDKAEQARQAELTQAIFGGAKEMNAKRTK